MFRAVRSGRVLLLSPVLVAVLATGCTSSDDPPEPRDEGSAEVATSVAGTARIATISGRLSKDRRAPLKSSVMAVVDDWIDAAYLGSYPRSDFSDAFAGFTRLARADARRAAATMTNQAIGEQVETVRATKRNVRIDALAVDNTPAGVTVRVQLELRLAGDDGGLERTDLITGALYMSKDDKLKRWQIFGFDMHRRQP